MTVSLHRRNHLSSNSFRSFYNDLDLSDVTLVCSDKKLISVHRAVLVSASKKFQKLLAQSRQPSHLLYMEQDSVSLQHVIRFIYLGECVVSQSDFVKTYELLQLFQIEGGLTTEESGENGQEELETLATKETVKCEDKTVTQIVLNEYDMEQVKEEPFTSTVNKDENNFFLEVKKLDDPFKYRCEKCDFISKSQVELIDHKREVHNETEYTCDQCDFTILINLTFSSKGISEKMSRHKRFKHDGISSSCDKCAFQADRPSKLKLHKETWHIIADKNWDNLFKFKCGKCDFISKGQVKLIEHKSEVHNETELTCDQCDFTIPYNQQATLKATLYKMTSHKRFEHDGIRSSCDKCAFQTNKPSKLKLHNETRHA